MTPQLFLCHELAMVMYIQTRSVSQPRGSMFPGVFYLSLKENGYFVYLFYFYGPFTSFYPIPSYFNLEVDQLLKEQDKYFTLCGP